MAISVDPPEVSRDLSKKAGYTFSILSDPNAEVIRRYDLLHVVGGLTGMILPGPQSSWWTRREWCVGSTSPRTFVCGRERTKCLPQQRVCDSEAFSFAEALSRPPMRFVPIKTDSVLGTRGRMIHTPASGSDQEILGRWSANRKCALSSALFRRVEVPLALK